MCVGRVVWDVWVWVRMQDPSVAAQLGRQARKHVQENFSRKAFGAKLDSIVRALARRSGTVRSRSDIT